MAPALEALARVEADDHPTVPDRTADLATIRTALIGPPPTRETWHLIEKLQRTAVAYGEANPENLDTRLAAMEDARLKLEAAVRDLARRAGGSNQ